MTAPWSGNSQWALDEAHVAKQSRSGEMASLNWSGRAPVPVAQLEEHQPRKLGIPVQVLAGTVGAFFSTFSNALLPFPFPLPFHFRLILLLFFS